MHESRMQRIKDAAAAAPLVAALVAPLSTLLEIPALTVGAMESSLRREG